MSPAGWEQAAVAAAGLDERRQRICAEVSARPTASIDTDSRRRRH